MKNAAKLMFLSILILVILCCVTVFTTAGFTQNTNPLQIDKAEVAQYRNGNYRIILVLNEGPFSPPDVYFQNNLKDPNNYLLKEKAKEKEIELPSVSVFTSQDDLYQIMFLDVDITYKKNTLLGLENHFQL